MAKATRIATAAIGTTTATAMVPPEVMPLLEPEPESPVCTDAAPDVADAESAELALGVLTIVLVTTCVLVDPLEVMTDVATDSDVVGVGVEVVVGDVVESKDVVKASLDVEVVGATDVVDVSEVAVVVSEVAVVGSSVVVIELVVSSAVVVGVSAVVLLVSVLVGVLVGVVDVADAAPETGVAVSLVLKEVILLAILKRFNLEWLDVSLIGGAMSVMVLQGSTVDNETW